MDIKTIGISGLQIKQTETEQPARDSMPKMKSAETPAARGNNVSVTVNELPIQTRVVFAVDKDKNVTIQVIDKDGKVVKQIPPEEYINMVKKLKGAVESFYNQWA